jgi:hypothetical protein
VAGPLGGELLVQILVDGVCIHATLGVLYVVSKDILASHGILQPASTAVTAVTGAHTYMKAALTAEACPEAARHRMHLTTKGSGTPSRTFMSMAALI